MIQGDWKEYFRKMFSVSDESFVELDDDDIADYSPEFENVGFGDWLTKNGFSKREIFNQINIYYNHIFDMVFTSEYSDNTGSEYWHYFDSAKKYNEYICMNNEGMR